MNNNIIWNMAMVAIAATGGWVMGWASYHYVGWPGSLVATLPAFLFGLYVGTFMRIGHDETL